MILAFGETFEIGKTYSPANLGTAFEIRNVLGEASQQPFTVLRRATEEEWIQGVIEERRMRGVEEMPIWEIKLHLQDNKLRGFTNFYEIHVD